MDIQDLLEVRARSVRSSNIEWRAIRGESKGMGRGRNRRND